MATAKLTVPDISCAHCERTVVNTLSPMAGVRQVSVDLASKTVTVGYDPELVDSNQLSEALAAEEYPVAAFEDVSR